MVDERKEKDVRIVLVFFLLFILLLAVVAVIVVVYFISRKHETTNNGGTGNLIPLVPVTGKFFIQMVNTSDVIIGPPIAGNESFTFAAPGPNVGPPPLLAGPALEWTASGSNAATSWNGATKQLTLPAGHYKYTITTPVLDDGNIILDQLFFCDMANMCPLASVITNSLGARSGTGSGSFTLNASTVLEGITSFFALITVENTSFIFPVGSITLTIAEA